MADITLLDGSIGQWNGRLPGQCGRRTDIIRPNRRTAGIHRTVVHVQDASAIISDDSLGENEVVDDGGIVPVDDH